ncbi:DUF7344 domain-containing protein [Halomontanus rarus]|uniref:DUF7344 domain-containing protein n=1 Tax=Halomontanus rarus TaxID=3034020 RepID=UPI0023E7CE08|nr:hypothetical protein [Halovivax sp. TS33]
MGFTQLGRDETNPSAKTGSSRNEPTGPSEQLPLDDVFKILSNQRRRYVIAHLDNSDDNRFRVRDLTDQVAAWENDVSIQEVTYKERKRVYTSLYQSHLPKMDNLGIIRYDQSRGIVERLQTIDQLGTYLDSLDSPDDDGDDDELRSYVSVGVAGLCVVFVIVSGSGLLPFLPQTGFGIALAIALILLIEVGVHVANFHYSAR